MKRLPRSIDELSGLRAARWIRESTPGQFDRFGPDAQRDQQDRAIARYGLVDTGEAWSVAHSGRTIARSSQFAAMLAAAGAGYDVLVVGYVSRFARDLETAVNARRDLHRAGAVILFADEGILTSDEDAWERWAREAVEAEAYSRRLARRIAEGYAAKFRQLRDQAGNPPLGFRRIGAERRLEVDPTTIGLAVEMFRRYATGDVSMEQLAGEMAIGEEQVRKALSNPLYNGWARRHRGQLEERVATSWRADPPISDELWARVEEMRRRRVRSAGAPRRVDRVDLLRGLVHCVCGRRIRADGTMGTPPRRRRLHPGSCDEWGSRASYAADVWETPVVAQVSGIRLDEATIARVVRALSRPSRALVSIDRARLERRKRELALDHAAGRLDDVTYLARVARIRAELEAAAPEASPDVTADRAVTWLRDLRAAWRDADELERAGLVRAIYDRIEVRGPFFTAITLTPSAYRHGLALALPENVHWRPRQASEHLVPTGAVRMPIVGREEWLRATRSA